MIGYLVEENQEQQLKFMYIGVVIRDVGVDGAGNWATHIGRQDPNRRIEAQQYRLR